MFNGIREIVSGPEVGWQDTKDEIFDDDVVALEASFMGMLVNETVGMLLEDVVDVWQDRYRWTPYWRQRYPEPYESDSSEDGHERGGEAEDENESNRREDASTSDGDGMEIDSSSTST